MNRVRIALAGLGFSGTLHLQNLLESNLFKLIAVCDNSEEKVERISSQAGVLGFSDYKKMIDEVEIDAVVIATPHILHADQSVLAFNKGLHVLVEKPLAVQVGDAQRIIDTYNTSAEKNPGIVFSIVFQHRLFDSWKRVKTLLNNNELGKLMRVTWINTDWFRTQYYYDCGSWRATWKGEGGGLLVNQSPHNLDIYQWLFGMPQEVTAFYSTGKYHEIEVEDEVSAFFQHENGMIGHFICSTAESPGTNRLEICGELGKLVYENEQVTIFKNSVSCLEVIEKADESFPEIENIETSFRAINSTGNHHALLLQNFGRAILFHEPLVAPGVDGICSLTISNGLILSGLEKKKVCFPIDSIEYGELLKKQIKSSSPKKNIVSEYSTSMKGALNSN